MESEKGKKQLSEKELVILLISIVLFIVAIMVIFQIIELPAPIHEYQGTPAGQWNRVESTGNSSGNLTFGSFTSRGYHDEIRIIVYVNGTYAGNFTVICENGNQPQSLVWFESPNGAEAFYYDYNPDGGRINSGDYIYLTGLLSNTTYEFEVFDIPTESTVSMTGDEGIFTTNS